MIIKRGRGSVLPLKIIMIENKCKRCGDCCRQVLLQVNGLGEDEIKWLNYHSNIHYEDGLLLIKSTCIHLKRVNRQYICDIHNTDKYPLLCEKGACMKDLTSYPFIKLGLEEIKEKKRR